MDAELLAEIGNEILTLIYDCDLSPSEYDWHNCKEYLIYELGYEFTDKELDIVYDCYYYLIQLVHRDKSQFLHDI